MDLAQDYQDGSYKNTSVYECLTKLVSTREPNRSIDDLLEYVGEKCKSERTYIFEKSEYESISNTYEWCADGVKPQKDLLQKEPIETISWWWDLFEDDKAVVIKNLEEVKDLYPRMYAALKPQEINSLVTTPIRSKGELIGFVGVDNPEDKTVDATADFLLEIGQFLAFVIERRDLVNKLEYLSYHDQLTGAFNRHAYGEYLSVYKGDKPIGVVYCDVSELKYTNDNLGHSFGDKLINYWFELLKAVFPREKIYRIGGDEFVIFSESQVKEEFNKSISRLSEMIYNNQNHLAIGAVWSDILPIDLTSMMSRAEKAMYKDKSNYYSKLNPLTGKTRDRRQRASMAMEKSEIGINDELTNFLHSNHFDPRVFFRGISTSDFYPYIGDLQTNLFYISDEMKEQFGFQNNIVSDLVGAWEKRFADVEELEMYRKDIEEILSGKKDFHDMRYRIKDKAGNNVWVHCQGKIKWNSDHTQPLFFAGGVSRQEQDFVVDAITNFPKEFMANKRIQELQKKEGTVTILGFTLNNFSEINELRGRYATNIFLSKVSKKLLQHFESKLAFFRLDGMRFIAIVLPGNEEEVETLIHQLKEIISNVYYSDNVVVQVPCSVGVIHEIGEEKSPQDILGNMMALLNQAKHAPEKDYLIYSRKNIYSQKTRAQLIMELNRNVIDGFKNFRIVVQPVVSTEKMSIASAEVLLRWSFEGKDVSPTIFIPMLENNRLILMVGKWVLEQAIRTCARVNSYLPNFRLAINVSYYQILDKEFLPYLKETLKRYNLSGERIILEITETHYDETPTKVRQFVENCRMLGIDVAIDDFGDGYSSLAFLIKYPATIVKLDRSLINEMVSSKDNINFIASIVYACHKFGKKVCAEGVETKEEFDIIKDSGCDMIQGYYFYHPLELDEFYGILPNS